MDPLTQPNLGHPIDIIIDPLRSLIMTLRVSSTECASLASVVGTVSGPETVRDEGQFEGRTEPFWIFLNAAGREYPRGSARVGGGAGSVQAGAEGLFREIWGLLSSSVTPSCYLRENICPFTPFLYSPSFAALNAPSLQPFRFASFSCNSKAASFFSLSVPYFHSWILLLFLCSGEIRRQRREVEEGSLAKIVHGRKAGSRRFQIFRRVLESSAGRFYLVPTGATLYGIAVHMQRELPIEWRARASPTTAMKQLLERVGATEANEMKIRCDVCERAEAALLCCADEAALCLTCDEKIHAANKLAGKHQRLPLLNPSSQFPSPKCDICQDKVGYFFCLEDRALLCRQCDVSIHTATPYVTSHQRFLVTGVKVGLHQHSASSSAAPSADACKSSLSSTSTFNTMQPEKKCRRSLVSEDVITAATTLNYSQSGDPAASDCQQHWPLDELLAGGPEFDHGYIFPELGSSRDSSQ
ncbi:hypothetical protein H6P81_001618 [Aristolochia fimbriata]|uniref:B box-type domain-containing protein n=1 Tax=Aristolochia fimbriata TaxID=158543 RepID=A0AAV7F7D5_ARIFI|nr:hypothetical protein H6P81_001618 [Aristolochia fimbriata]